MSYNAPMIDFDSTPIIFAYYYNISNEKAYIKEEHISYNSGTRKVSITLQEVVDGDITEIYYYDSVEETGPIGIGDTIFVEIGADFHNKYQYYHDLELDLVTNNFRLLNWEMGQDQVQKKLNLN